MSLLGLPCPRPHTPHPPKEKKITWIWILCQNSPTHPKKKKLPGFGFFVKIHLLESLKLGLYDLYFRRNS